MSKPVILTGLRANNDLTLGNYFGALLPLVDMAKKRAGEYQINLFVPDLHSFTTPIDYSQLQAGIRNNLRTFIAAGLPIDHDNVYLYRQSYIPAHSELAWILDNFTGMGELERMTQYKDKTHVSEADIEKIFYTILNDKYPNLYKGLYSASDEDYTTKFHKEILTIYSMVNDVVRSDSKESQKVGLFNYPVLMAADILLYGAKYVPVGDDQTQHLEFTRDIAERMNNKFGELFVVPEPVKKQHEFFGKEQGLRIMDLQNPSKKMSKSDDSGKGVIFLNDAPEDAAKKIMGATTDDKACVAYDRENQPGITNLLDILALLQGRDVKDVTAEYAGKEKYGEFKAVVAETVKTFLTEFQEAYARVDDTEINTALAKSEAAMNEQANATLLNVQKAVGLR